MRSNFVVKITICDGIAYFSIYKSRHDSKKMIKIEEIAPNLVQTFQVDPVEKLYHRL